MTTLHMTTCTQWHNLVTNLSVVALHRSFFSSCVRMQEKIHFNSFLCPSAHSGPANHLVILNSDSFCAKLTTSMWSKCEIKVCADGGANRLYDSLLPEVRSDYIPQYIVGDLDSLRPEVKAFYK